VIDDEPLARARIIKLCQQYDYISVLAEAKNGKEATQAIQKYKPELIFLDVQMPDFNGFEVLQKSDLPTPPFIIFVTAFDRYALKAFDIKAVDYLLKPYDDERFDKAISHAKQQIDLSDNARLNHKMQQLFNEFQHQRSEQLTILEIKDKGRNHLIKIDDVYYFEAHGNYLKVHCGSKTYLHRITLQEIENQLDKNQFLRIHRSTIINTIYIQASLYKGNNQYCFHLTNHVELQSGRSYKEEIQQFLVTRNE